MGRDPQPPPQETPGFACLSSLSSQLSGSSLSMQRAEGSTARGHSEMCQGLARGGGAFHYPLNRITPRWEGATVPQGGQPTAYGSIALLQSLP